MTNLKNIKFESIIFNASGPKCTTKEELMNIDNSKSAIVLTKSATLNKRLGNESPRYYDNKFGSINSMGLPNNGINYYINVGNDITKPYFISICGLNINENLLIIEQIIGSLCNNKINGLEINLSCPNIIGKTQLAYDFKELNTYLSSISDIIANKLKNLLKNGNSDYLDKLLNLVIGVKLPPYFEIEHFKIVGSILSNYPINFVTCINSIGNGLIIDYLTESTTIKPKKGCGGIGGSYVKPTGLSNVWNFYNVFKELNSNIKIIGCGGISSGIDAFEYLLCGADMLQIGTQFYKEDVDCFERIENELNNILKYKKYKSYDEIRGKLKLL